MDKKYIYSLIEAENEGFKKRIFELNQKDITKSLSNFEANELDWLKDYYDFKIFDNVLQLIHDDYFSSLDNLQHYLRVEISKCDIPEDRSRNDNNDFQVYTIEKSNCRRLIILDTILFCIEFI